MIPARLNATRLPRKLLLPLYKETTILEQTFRQAKKTAAEAVWIVTDSQEIQTSANKFTGNVIRSKAPHSSGTSRIAEAVNTLGLAPERIIINLQGDEPFISPLAVNMLAQFLAALPNADAATLGVKLTEFKTYHDPNKVKIVLDKYNKAIYFSRAPIPFVRALSEKKAITPIQLESTWQHIGIYAYRAQVLQEYADLSPSPLEEIEKLEQLRLLWHGKKIYVQTLDAFQNIGIDTPEDLATARKLLQNTTF